MALSCDSGGGGGSEQGGSSSGGQDIAKVAMALTGGVDFEDGAVVEGLLPDPSNDTVKLDTSSTTLSLEPGGAELLPLEITNPDASDPDMQVEAVLIQFEGADDHIEVDVMGSDMESETVELPFMVDGNICDRLCAAIVQLKLLQAVRLANGDISEHLERVMELNCADDGDPALCEDTSGPSEPEPDAGMTDAGGGGTSDPSNTRANNFAAALIAANNGLCTSCTELMGMSPCNAMYPGDQTSIDCLKDAITAAPEAATQVNMLQQTLAMARSACASCDSTSCPPSLLSDHLADLPMTLADAILECAGGTLPPPAP